MDNLSSWDIEESFSAEDAGDAYTVSVPVLTVRHPKTLTVKSLVTTRDFLMFTCIWEGRPSETVNYKTLITQSSLLVLDNTSFKGLTQTIGDMRIAYRQYVRLIMFLRRIEDRLSRDVTVYALELMLPQAKDLYVETNSAMESLVRTVFMTLGINTDIFEAS